MEKQQDVWPQVRAVIADIFDRDPAAIAPETRIMVDLGGESVDLLEIAVRLNADFGIPVEENVVFLKDLRYLLAECRAEGRTPETALAEAYPHLTEERRRELAREAARPQAAPLLCAADIAAYVAAARSRTWHGSC